MADQALLDRLKRYSMKCLTERTDGDFAEAVWESVKVIEGLLNDLQEALNTVDQKSKELKDCREELQKPKWIPVTERLPECEQEVLICTEKKLVGGNAYIDSIVTPAIYEDGTMLENESKWRWEDMDWAGWDEEEDCGIIPEGWWENRHFNPDDVYNYSVDRKVVAWMPLPEPPKEETDG